MVGLMFVTIEVEELGLGKVHFGGDLVCCLVEILSGMAWYFCSLVDVQSSISAVALNFCL